jgi:hypothetical protein
MEDLDREKKPDGATARVSHARYVSHGGITFTTLSASRNLFQPLTQRSQGRLQKPTHMRFVHALYSYYSIPGLVQSSQIEKPIIQ